MAWPGKNRGVERLSSIKTMIRWFIGCNLPIFSTSGEKGFSQLVGQAHTRMHSFLGRSDHTIRLEYSLAMSAIQTHLLASQRIFHRE